MIYNSAGKYRCFFGAKPEKTMNSQRVNLGEKKMANSAGERPFSKHFTNGYVQESTFSTQIKALNYLCFCARVRDQIQIYG